MVEKVGIKSIDSIKEIEKGIKSVTKLEKTLHPAHSINRTTGQKAADKLTGFAGSWTFIILLFIFIFFWIYLNVTAYVNNWDPWPFIILNLVLSSLAGIQAPIILMSQNRANQRDRNRAEYDYRINKKAESEIQDMQKDLEDIKKLLKGGIRKK